MAAIIDIRTGASLLHDRRTRAARAQAALAAPVTADGALADTWLEPDPGPRLRVVHGGRSAQFRQRRRVFMIRRVLAVAAVLVVAVVGLRLGSMAVQAFSVPTADIISTPSADPSLPYVVQQGDTLAGIARDLAPAGDPAAVIEQIVELNAAAGVALDVDEPVRTGQRLALPVGLD
jgi:LysM domain